MHDFEKLGAFYLGKRYDTNADKLTEEFVLYDSMLDTGLPAHFRQFQGLPR